MRHLSTALCILVLAGALVLPSPVFAAWEEDLVESAANPVFDPPSGGSVYYPTVLYDADGFGAGEAGPFYRMWFSDGAGIGTAESGDGIAWSEGADCAGLLNPHHAKILYDAGGFGGGAGAPRYRIWYWDTSKLYTVAAIRTADSDDGVNWANDRAIGQDAAREIITGAGVGWNRGSYGPVHLFYQPGKQNAGADPFDYEYVMYYDGTTGAFEQVGLAYSADGDTWTRFGDGPVLASGSSWEGAWGAADPWDSSYSGFGSVIRDAEGKFHFWYSGGSTSMDMGIGYASSDDGVIWVRDAAPLVYKTPGTWYSKRAYTPAVLYDAGRFSRRGDNSEFKMWFAGRDDANNYQVVYHARSVASVDVAQGAKSPEVAGIRFGTPAPLLQIALTNDGVEEVLFTALEISLSGSAAADGVETLKLYADADADGAAGPGDVLIDESAPLAGSAVFGPFSRSFPRGSQESWLVVAVLSDRASVAQTLRARLESAGAIAAAGQDTGAADVMLASVPLAGNTMVVVDGAAPEDDAAEDTGDPEEGGGSGGDSSPAESSDGSSEDDGGDAAPDLSYMGGFGGSGGCSLSPTGGSGPAGPSLILALAALILAARRSLPGARR
ncbi:MAG TPA: hypothetical protein PLY45_01040 [bacterium]|nr:hypothetical protein [bacterium]